MLQPQHPRPRVSEGVFRLLARMKLIGSLVHLNTPFKAQGQMFEWYKVHYRKEIPKNISIMDEFTALSIVTCATSFVFFSIRFVLASRCHKGL